VHDQRVRSCPTEYGPCRSNHNANRNCFSEFFGTMTAREESLPLSPSSSEFSDVGSKAMNCSCGRRGDQDSIQGGTVETSSVEPSWSPLDAWLSLSEVACGGSPNSLSSRRRTSRGSQHTGVLPELAPARFFFQSIPLDERARQNSILQGVDSTHSEVLTLP
jgi:hypothetical protein